MDSKTLHFHAVDVECHLKSWTRGHLNQKSPLLMVWPVFMYMGNLYICEDTTEDIAIFLREGLAHFCKNDHISA